MTKTKQNFGDRLTATFIVLLYRLIRVIFELLVTLIFLIMFIPFLLSNRAHKRFSRFFTTDLSEYGKHRKQ